MYLRERYLCCSFSSVNAHAVTLHADRCLYVVLALVGSVVLFTVSPVGVDSSEGLSSWKVLSDME